MDNKGAANMIDELSIEVGKEDGALVIWAKGRINTNTAPKFEEAVLANLDEVEKVILDFAELEYISSAGIRVVLMILKKMECRKENLIIRNFNEDIRETLTITGFTRRITMEGTVETEVENNGA
jgi:anti-anti-sigma factor